MTFVLKDLNQLRREFDETVTIILKRDKKGKIEDLLDPRKYELQFLTSLLDKLEMDLRTATTPYPSHQQTKSESQVFYGAMYLIIKDIESNHGPLDKPGLLSNRLAESIGISDADESDKPTLHQQAKLYSHLNAFLLNVFDQKDSRKGFLTNHFLHAVPTEHLVKLIKTSYTLEKETQKEFIRSLSIDGKGEISAKEYKPLEELTVPKSATERFKTWSNLKSALDNLITDELGDKSASNLKKINPTRATQLSFLKSVEKSLDSKKASTEKKPAPEMLSDLKKIAILAGAMHLVHKQIYNEYTRASHLQNSVVYTGLTKILGTEAINPLDETVTPQDVEALIRATNMFVNIMSIESKKTIRGEHIFSKISGFDLIATLQLFQDMICECRIVALSQVAPEKQSYLKSFESFATLFGRKKGTPEESDTEEQPEQLTAPRS